MQEEIDVPLSSQILAAEKGHPNILEIFLEFGANVESSNELGATLLILAAKGGHLSAVEVLLKHSADVNARDSHLRTALSFASEGGHVQICQRLMERGAEVNTVDREGNTPLHYSSANGHLETVKLLVNGSDGDVTKRNEEPDTSLNRAISGNDDAETVRRHTWNRAGSGVAVGIDLGTTSSCVAVWKDGEAHVLFNEHGNRLTPCYVEFDGTYRWIGNGAKQGVPMVLNPENTVYDMNRLIGRNYDDPEVQRHLQSWSFSVVNVAGKPLVEVQYHGEKKRFYPEQISSMILEHLKTSTAESSLGTKVTDAVVTVPAYFNEAQRQATRDAAEMAGLNVLEILDEPIAAAIAYGLENMSKEERNVLVYDLRDETFDVTVITIKNKTFKVRATCGDTHLGGRDFDNIIVDYLVDILKRNRKKDITGNHRAMQRLRIAWEEAKEALYNVLRANVVIDNICDGFDFKYYMSRHRFEDHCQQLFGKTLEIVKQVLSDAKIDKKDIQDVVLVGGSTRIPRIQAMVEEFFDGKQLCKNVNPDEAVAIGAAIRADSVKHGPTFHYTLV